MIGAFGWGLLAASSLVVGALVALAFRIPVRVVGLIMGFGSGVLISAVAFDLVEEAVGDASADITVPIGMAVGCAVFSVGDWLIARNGGGRRKSPKRPVAALDRDRDGTEDSPLSIVLGTVLDGIPESIVIGLTLLAGEGVGVAYLVAVFVSNLPESISSTAGLVESGWRRSRILWLWVAVAVVSGAASAAGYGIFDGASGNTNAAILAFAGGAILTMLADTMMPEAFEHGGRLTGVLTTAGFVVAFTLHQLA